MALLGYTNRTNVENLYGKTFPEISSNEFDLYLGATEKWVNNYLGYNALTTTSGILTEKIVREKKVGKMDNYGNLVVDLSHPPVHFDINNNPMVDQLTFNMGGVEVILNLTDGSKTGKNSFLESSENRRKIYYPNMYFLPAISTVTPTAKINLFNLRDVRFWTDISYTGGYDTIPEDITMAASFMALEFVTHRTNPNFFSTLTQGSMTMQFMQKSNQSKKFTTGENMRIAQSLLQPYVINTW